MKKQVSSIFLLLLVTLSSVEAGETCKPSGKIKGKKAPAGKCNKENGLSGVKKVNITQLTSVHPQYYPLVVQRQL